MAAGSPHEKQRARQDRRLARLRERIAVVSALGFAALFGLAAQHSIGGQKHVATTLVRRTAATAAAPSRFFDDQADGFAFGDDAHVAARSPAPAAPARTPAQQPVTQSPPVAQTSVS